MNILSSVFILKLVNLVELLFKTGLKKVNVNKTSNFLKTNFKITEIFGNPVEGTVMGLHNSNRKKYENSVSSAHLDKK